jgi:putative ABC transport system permease protein
MTIRGVFERLRASVRGRRLDRELEDEIQAHLEMAERDARARGLPPEQARRAARQTFGGIQQVKDEHRDRRSFRWIEIVLKDVRYGLAALGRSPGFTAVVVGVLALGIGANVAMFGVLDAVLLKPLLFPQPDRIVRVWEAPKPGITNAASATEFLNWKRLAGIFEAMSAEAPVSATLATDGSWPTRLPGKAVTTEYFKVFGVKATLGRTFTTDEDKPGAGRVIVLSHAAWQNDFGGDPEILQRRPMLDGEPYQVVGVLAPGAFDRDRTRFWKPLPFTQDQLAPEIHWLTVYGRLASGVTLSQANDRMQAINTGLLPAKPANDREGTVLVAPLARLLVGRNLERSVYVAFGAVTLVLLIACANVVNLLLARGALREKELAVRAALGASRGRLIAQLLTESIILCVLGGVAGIAAAGLLIRVARPLVADSLPFTADLRLDVRVFAFAGVVAFGAALFAGLLPAFRASFGDVARSLNRSVRGESGAHAPTRRAIVVGEVALSMVLMCGALLLFRSLVKLQEVDTGVRMENVITMSTDLPVGAYPTPQKAAVFYEQVAQRLQSTPDVLQAGLATQLPLQWIINGEGILVPGMESIVRVRFKRVDPGYFRALGIPVLSGRGIGNQDREGTPRIIVINQALATRLAEIPGMKDPVGKVVRVSTPLYLEKKPFIPSAEIVGVIRNERVSSPGDPDPPVVYAAFAQAPTPSVRIIVRTASAPATVLPAIREAVREVNPNLPLADVATMEQVRDRTLIGASRPAGLIGVFAAIAVLLTAIGLYGVLAQAVTQRRREIGIRMALGAVSSDVIRQVLWGAVGLVAVGLGLGLLGAFALTGVMKNLLFEVSPLDPVALTTACVSMVLIGLFAGFIPASRAAKVDPVVTLRDEG